MGLSMSLPALMIWGRMYETERSTDCWYKSCERTINPVVIESAVPRMRSKELYA